MALLRGNFSSRQESGSVGLKTIWGSGHFMMYVGAACGVFGDLENARPPPRVRITPLQMYGVCRGADCNVFHARILGLHCPTATNAFHTAIPFPLKSADLRLCLR